MVIATTLPIDRPRISANQLGEFPFATPAKKLAILANQKFGNEHCAPYYHSACCTLLREFDAGQFKASAITREIMSLRSERARNRNHAARLENNALMLERFLQIRDATVPSAGLYEIVRRNALLDLDDVTISVRPEIMTRNPGTGFFALTKLRFSKSRISADSSEIVLLLILKYAQQLPVAGFQLDPQETRLVDCYSRTVVPAHTLPRLRENQLQAALREIRRLWPTIHGRDSDGEFRSNT